MPVRDYDNLLVGEYIRSIENPDSIGFKDGKWFQSPRKVDDPNNRGFGVDIKYNDKARELVKDRKGKWLSEKEERDLRNSHIDYVMGRIDKWTPQMLQEMPSEEKRVIAAGMLYRGDGIKNIIKNPALRDTFYSGTPKEFSKAVEDFYKEKNSNHYQPERARLHKEFMSKQPFNQLGFKVTEFKSDNSLFAKGGLLEPKDAWDRLSIPEKADIIKVGVKHGIFDLQKLRRKYNEFKEGESKEEEEEVNTEESYNQNIEEAAPDVSGYLANIDLSKLNYNMYSPTEYSIGGPLVDAAKYRDENIYDFGGVLDWLKGLFCSKSQIKYKAADGKLFDSKKEAALHNSSLVKEGKIYSQKESKTFGVKNKLVPRKLNTSSTSQKSTILENTMYMGLDGNRERTGYRTKAYDIPYGTKEIRVKPKGTTLPFNVSVNALDSVAKYAGVTGTPIQTALGLPYQETAFGRNPLINYENLGDKYSATDLGNANYFKAFGSIPAEYLVRDFRYNGDLLIDGKRDEPISMDTPPLQHAFEYFNAGKYNTKASNHTEKVKATGNALWNETTGSLQNWWNTEGKEWYNKGAKQRKK